ncbi:MAG: hypothetical protein ACO3CL_07605 [Bacteroidia bacterium]
MPIADSTLILEGQQNFSGGMDSSLSPGLIRENAVSMAVNLTFRGGNPSTRPGLRQVLLRPGVNGGLDALTFGLFQGSFFYIERRANYNSLIFAVVGGRVIAIDTGTLEVDQLYPLNNSGVPVTSVAPLDPYEKCYFVQAEKYLIIQNGKDVPLIWDGTYLYRSGVGPAGSTGQVSQLHTIDPGTVMAYGQGRLFVADKERIKITAGDIVFGGSTDQVSIVSGQHSGGKYRFTTATAHGYSDGDRITITGHSSEFGLNGTWEITNASGTHFDIEFSNNDAQGLGGFASKANFGKESDLLRFTETTYLAEGGALQVPSFMGKITGLIFMPVQDTTTGQGDLLAFCERGTASFAVSVPRDDWKSTQAFQRVAFPAIGSTSHESLVTNNGDIFFRSFDGLRSYRNARAELSDSYGQVPLSAEMNAVLRYDSKALLGDVSAIVFDNRLLFTASPSVRYQGINPDAPVKVPTTFSKIVALDFTTLASVGGKRAPSYDGVWNGFDVLQLLTGIVAGSPRAYAFVYDFSDGRVNVLWEITESAPFDYPANVEPQRIKSILETRSFYFGSPAEQKRMIRADFWLADLQGRVDVDVYWRPDQYPCWRPWHSFSRCATVDNCLDSGVTFTVYNNSTTWICFNEKTPVDFYFRLGRNGKFTEPVYFSPVGDGIQQGLDLKDALNAAGFGINYVTRIGTSPNFCFIIATGELPLWEEYVNVPFDYWESGQLWDVPFSPSLDSIPGPEFTFVPVTPNPETECETNFRLKNLQPQYRPQIRMPTPPEDTDPIISRPYYYGNEFQLRLEFTGHFELNKLLMLGQRILEQYQGTDTLEIL